MTARRDELAEWVREAAVPLHAVTGLEALTGSADVIFLGELNHFIHEKSDFRLALLGPLIKLGWSALAEELGWSDGWRVQSYLRSGDEAELQRLATFGYRGDARTDRSDAMGGVLKASADAYPVGRFAAEQSRFYRALRDLEPSAYRGIDIDPLPGGAYADVQLLLPESLSSPFRRAPGETAEEEASRLRRQLAATAGMDPEPAAALAALADSLDYVACAFDAPDYQALRPAMAMRETFMKRRAEAALRLKPPQARGLVFMAHAFHLSKNDRLFPSGVGGVGPGGGLTSSLGHHLVQSCGLQACSIWMIYGEGQDSQPFPDLPNRADFPPQSLNRRLATFQEPVFIPLCDAPDRLLEAPIPVGHMYNSLVPVQLKGQVDAICYFPMVSELRL